MKSRFVFVFVVLWIFNQHVLSQVPVGPNYDTRGIPFDGYFDAMLYLPKSKLNVFFEDYHYKEGHFYDNEGIKYDGFIKFNEDILRFRTDKFGKSKNLKYKYVESFVVGVDSFIKVNNFYIGDYYIKEDNFLQYIDEINGITYLKHYCYDLNCAEDLDESDLPFESYLAKSKTESYWNSLYGSDITDVSKKCFANVPVLHERIEGVYNPNGSKIYDLIKTADYWQKFSTGHFIYFDKNWNEIKEKTKLNFGIIKAASDSLWTIEYYNNSVLIYEINFKTIFPQVRNGNFIAFYPDGKMRKKVYFNKNKPISTQVFNENGILTEEYDFVDFLVQKVRSSNPPVIYKRMNGFDLKEFDKLGYGKLDVLNEDSLSYKRVFSDYKLVESFYSVNGNTVYQYINHNYDLNIERIQKKLDNYIEGANLVPEGEGIVLVKLVFDTEGYIINCKMLNSIDRVGDELLEKFFLGLFKKKNSNKFDTYKFNNKEEICELIIPVVFTKDKPFNPSPLNYFMPYNNVYFHHQMMQFNPPQMHFQINFSLPGF